MGTDLYISEEPRFHVRLIGGPCEKCTVPGGLLYLHGPHGHVQVCYRCALGLMRQVETALEPVPANLQPLLPPLPILEGWEALAVRWFNTAQVSILGSILFQYTIGAVLTRTPHGLKAYLGVCFGHDQNDDIRSIAQTGARLDPDVAALFFPDVADWSST